MSSGVPCSAKYPRGPSPSRGRVSRKQQVPQRSPIRKTQHPRGRPSAKHSTPEVAHPPQKHSTPEVARPQPCALRPLMVTYSHLIWRCFHFSSGAESLKCFLTMVFLIRHFISVPSFCGRSPQNTRTDFLFVTITVF